MIQTKSTLRTHFKSEILQFLGTPSGEAATRAMQAQIAELLKTRSGNWGAFSPDQFEPQVFSMHESNQASVQWAFPCIDGNHLSYRISRSKKYRVNQFNIREPDPNESEVASQLQGVFVPGLAFDSEGFRLGRGKGFFDRFLAQFNGEKVGVCFELQRLEHFPATAVDAWDQKVDLVLTEKKTHITHQRKR